MRGGHAHRKCHQLVVPIYGWMKAKSYQQDGTKDFFNLNSPKYGLYVPPMNWLEISGFQRRAVMLVLASEEYDESDYIRTPSDFTTHPLY